MDQEDLVMMKVLLQHLVKRKEEIWRVMMVVGGEDVVVVVEGSEDVVVSGAVEASVGVSVEDIEVEEEGSEEIEVDSVVAVGLEEEGEDSEGVEEDSAEVTTEVKAVLNSRNTHHHKFTNYQKVLSLLQPHRLKFVFSSWK